jgi:hypothetical protein
LDTIENDTSAIGMYVGDDNIKTSGGLEQGWPTLNNWEKGKKRRRFISTYKPFFIYLYIEI